MTTLTPSNQLQMTYNHNLSELEIQDHNNEPSSSKLVPNVYPSANTTAPSLQELNLLFISLYDEFFNAGNSSVPKKLQEPEYGMNSQIPDVQGNHLGLWYSKDSGFKLTAFSDTGHAGCLDTRKSTSGGIQLLGDKLVRWISKKQDCTTMSSAEAEYVALSASCAQLITEYQLADMFTKALPEERFQYLVRRIGMRCLTPAELEVLANETA
ncbi:hypothetical protein Tco_0720830 [Tanacetum coccineum]